MAATKREDPVGGPPVGPRLSYRQRKEKRAATGAAPIGAYLTFFELVGVGIGIGIGIAIGIDGPYLQGKPMFDPDSDCDPDTDSDPGKDHVSVYGCRPCRSRSHRRGL